MKLIKKLAIFVMFLSFIQHIYAKVEKKDISKKNKTTRKEKVSKKKLNLEVDDFSKEKTKKTLRNKHKLVKGNFFSNNDWRIGLGLLPRLPISDVSNSIGLGFGGRLSLEGEVPGLLSRKNPIRLRVGITTGVDSFSSNKTGFDTSLLIIPVAVDIKVQYNLLNKMISPYLKVSTGGAMALLTLGGLNDSSFDFLLEASLGTNYSPNKASPFSLFCEAQFNMQLEATTGLFLSFQLGATYDL